MKSVCDDTCESINIVFSGGHGDLRHSRKLYCLFAAIILIESCGRLHIIQKGRCSVELSDQRQMKHNETDIKVLYLIHPIHNRTKSKCSDYGMNSEMKRTI